MESSKIHLSEAELNLVGNVNIILTKNTIIKKTIALFNELQLAMVNDNKSSNPVNELYSVAPKISKGENYQGLPYIVLDYPRLSHNNGLCFIRTMFWWGQFFSSTLQLSGTYKELYSPKILSAYSQLLKKEYFIGIQIDPWHHHFEETNYRKIAAISPLEFEQLLLQQPHTKIAAKWPLQQWPDAENSLYGSWNFLRGLVA